MSTQTKERREGATAGDGGPTTVNRLDLVVTDYKSEFGALASIMQESVQSAARDAAREIAEQLVKETAEASFRAMADQLREELLSTMRTELAAMRDDLAAMKQPQMSVEAMQAKLGNLFDVLGRMAEAAPAPAASAPAEEKKKKPKTVEAKAEGGTLKLGDAEVEAHVVSAEEVPDDVADQMGMSKTRTTFSGTGPAEDDPAWELVGELKPSFEKLSAYCMATVQKRKDAPSRGTAKFNQAVRDEVLGHIGRNIRMFRDLREYTQPVLSEMVGWKGTYPLSPIENGNYTKVTEQVRKDLAQALNIKVEWLLLVNPVN